VGFLREHTAVKGRERKGKEEEERKRGGCERGKERQENEEREEGRSGSRCDRVGSQSTVTNGCIPI